MEGLELGLTTGPPPATPAGLGAQPVPRSRRTDALEVLHLPLHVRSGPSRPLIIAELGSALGLDTVAEGIETEGQLAELHQLGCRLGQGYVFSPAVVPAKLRPLLLEARPRTASLA